METELDLWVFQAEVCLKANRYDDTVDCVKKVVRLSRNQLTPKERTLLSLAYKHSVGARRTSWRSLYTLEKQEQSSGQPRCKLARAYRKHVENELKDICTELLNMLEDRLIPEVKDPESDVFYHKLKADYYRYLAEVEVDNADLTMNFIEKANESYQGAMSHASVNLAATHPLRLGLVLNYSVFLHEQKRKPTKAYKTAQHTYDEAVAELDKVDAVDEVRYKECSNMLRLLKENLRVWREEFDNADDLLVS